jgi:lysophospholipase L1-like esterase
MYRCLSRGWLGETINASETLDRRANDPPYEPTYSGAPDRGKQNGAEELTMASMETPDRKHGRAGPTGRCIGMRDSVAVRWLLAGLAGLAVMLSGGLGSGAAAARGSRPSAQRASLPSCSSDHWVGSWIDSPSDSDSATDASLDTFVGGPSQTLRMIITPHLGGRVVRVHLSNRFGSGPVTFSDVTIAHAASGAALVSGSVRSVTFNHSSSVTVPAGEDVVSDPVRFSFAAFDNLAVSMYLAGYPGLPTEHFTARQTSYYTPPGLGDHASDPAATAFIEHTTARYYVDGLDVLAPNDVGSVVAFGDSITDGYQTSSAAELPETASTLNTNGRWPDDLQRRLIAARDDRISILNAGISGNAILANGQIPMFGPSGLSRFQLDGLDQVGVTEVIVLEGINDIGQSSATAAQLEAGYDQLVTAAHAAHLKILLGTLTPTGSATGVGASYSSAQSEATREAVNTWIRSGASGADGVIDFDAAVRDPADPSEIAPAYDGGDGIHFNLAGYQALANAVDLSQLKPPACR